LIGRGGKIEGGLRERRGRALSASLYSTSRGVRNSSREGSEKREEKTKGKKIRLEERA